MFCCRKTLILMAVMCSSPSLLAQDRPGLPETNIDHRSHLSKEQLPALDDLIRRLEELTRQAGRLENDQRESRELLNALARHIQWQSQRLALLEGESQKPNRNGIEPKTIPAASMTNPPPMLRIVNQAPRDVEITLLGRRYLLASHSTYTFATIPPGRYPYWVNWHGDNQHAIRMTEIKPQQTTEITVNAPANKDF